VERSAERTELLIGGGTIRFYGVIEQIRQAMDNLVSNALDTVTPGGRVWLDRTTDRSFGAPSFALLRGMETKPSSL
jgi:hypothetical protein